MKQPEYELQKSVVNYIRWKYKNLLYCGSAGGVRTSMTQAKKMKATGYVKGFPDLFIYEARHGYYGLAIELKVKGNYASQHQKEWISKLNERRYFAKVCTGLDETVALIDDYMTDGVFSYH
jgi:hypothetical protein